MRSEHVLCVPCWRAHKAAAAAARAAEVAAATAAVATAAAVGDAPEAGSGNAPRATPQGEGSRGEEVEVETMRLFCCLRPEFLYRLRAMCPRPQPAGGESPGSTQQRHQHQHQQQPATVVAPAAPDMVMEDDARGDAAPSEVAAQPCGSGGAQGAAAQEAAAHAAAPMAATMAGLTAAGARGSAGGEEAVAWPAAIETGHRLPRHRLPSTGLLAPLYHQPHMRQQHEPPPPQQQQAGMVNGPRGGWEGATGDANALPGATPASWAQQHYHHGHPLQPHRQGSTATSAALLPHASQTASALLPQYPYHWNPHPYYPSPGQRQPWHPLHTGYSPAPSALVHLRRAYPPVNTLHCVHRPGGLVLRGGNSSWSGLEHHHQQHWATTGGYVTRQSCTAPCGVQEGQAEALPNAVDDSGGQSSSAAQLRPTRVPGAAAARVVVKPQQQEPQQHWGKPFPPQPMGTGAASCGQEAGAQAPSHGAAASAAVSAPAVLAANAAPLRSSPCATEQPALLQHDRNLHSLQPHQPEQQQQQNLGGQRSQRPGNQQREDPLFPSSCGPALATALYNTRITLPGQHMAASLGLPPFCRPHRAAPAAGPAPSKPPAGKGVPAGAAKSAKASQWYDSGAVSDTPEYFAGALVRAAPHCRLGPHGAPGGTTSGTSSTSSSEDLVEEDLCYIIHKERLLQLPPQRKAELVELARDHNGRGGPVVFSGPMVQVDDPGGILDEVLGISRQCEEQIARNSREAKRRQWQGQGRSQGQGVFGAGEGTGRPSKDKDEGKQAEQRASTASAGAGGADGGSVGGEDEDQVCGPFPWLVDGVQWSRDGHLHPREKGIRADMARCGWACGGRCCQPGSGLGVAAKGAGALETSPSSPPRDHCYNPVSLCCMDMAHRCARLGA